MFWWWGWGGAGLRAWRPETSKPPKGDLGLGAAHCVGQGVSGCATRARSPAGGRARAGGRWAAFPGEVGGRVYFCSSGVYVNEKRMELQTARRSRCGHRRLNVPGPIKGRTGWARFGPLAEPPLRLCEIASPPSNPPQMRHSLFAIIPPLHPWQPAVAQSDFWLRKKKKKNLI